MRDFIPELIEKLTRGLRVDVIKSLSNIASLTLASPLGVPLTLNVTNMAIFKVEGHVKVSNLPSWSSVFMRFPTINVLPKIKVEVDLKPLYVLPPWNMISVVYRHMH